MNKEEFLIALQAETASFSSAVATEEGQWIIKGFIDVYKKIYTISIDTKVVSKVLELLLFPLFKKFADQHHLRLELSPLQNFYPDITLISESSGEKYAVDIKSTYRVDKTKASGMTLGAFTGYFRNRTSNKNTLYPYGQYVGHYVVGVIYSQSEGVIDERKQYKIEDLNTIPSVIRDFQFFAQPKYKLASTSPGSGNTKNIGSVNKIQALVNGEGPFAQLGEEIYDDYWMFYLTKDMAAALSIPRPYINLKTYLEYKSKAIDVLKAHEEEIKHLVEDETAEEEG